MQPDVDLDSPMPEVGNKLPLGLRLNEYEITGVLGEGGFGIVYLALDHSLQRHVALKEYMPASLARRAPDLKVEIRDEDCAPSFEAGLRSFVNEAKLLARFDHPALLKVHRFWQSNGTAYMVMPFYDGMTLKRALAERDQPPDEQWLRDMLMPLLDALEYLHAASCYHRDIAPDNIILIDGGRPLLLDFGAARRLIGDMNKAVTVILKSGYAPIEQYGETPGLSQGPWTDIYALGAVLHFAITGTVPRASVSRMLGDKAQPLAQRAAGRYSVRLLRAIDRMLAVQPRDRPQSIAELRRLMGEGPSGQVERPSRVGLQAGAISAMASSARLGRTTVVVSGLLAGAALILGLGGIWYFSTPTPTPDPIASTAVNEPTQPSIPPAPPPLPTAGPQTAPLPLPPQATAKEPLPEPTPDATILASPKIVASEIEPASPRVSTLPVVSPTRSPALASPIERTQRRIDSPAAPADSESSAPAPRMLDSARCTDIVQRVSIGEALTAADRRILKQECGR